MAAIRTIDKSAVEHRSTGSPVEDADRLRRAKRQNELLDEALEETFPASDPVSIVRIL